MKVPFVNLKASHAPLRAEFDRAIAEVIDRGAFAGGPFVERFEGEFAQFCHCRHAVGLGSGTEALWLVLLAAGIGPGDEVITVPMTFMATAEAITYAGAKPVFVDVDEQTYTMDATQLSSALTPRTKAIIPVHLFGQVADMDPILEFAQRHGLMVIEDAAQAHGATYKDRVAGSLGHAACFSFYPGKNLGAFGEAGAVVTNDTELQNKVRILRDHGQVRKYQHGMIGWNCRMDGIQAAVLSVKLPYLDRGNSARRTRADRYNTALEGLDMVVRPWEAEYGRHVYHIYAIRTQEREDVMRRLAQSGIECGIHYPIPVHRQEAYRHLGYEPGAFPVAEKIAEEFISLPMFPELTDEQQDAVIGALREAIPAGLVA